MQRYSWDDFKNDARSAEQVAGDAVSAVGSGIESAGAAVAGGVEAVGSTVTGGVQAAGQAVAGAAGSVTNAAGGVVDWIKSEAGKLALRTANALAAKFGGKVTVSPSGGIDITIADVEVAKVEQDTRVLPLGIPTETLFEAPFTVGDFVINTWFGTVIGDPAVTTMVGPLKLRNILLHLDPFGANYAGIGEFYAGSAVSGSIEKAHEGRVQAAGVIPFEVPIPIEASAAAGIRSIWRINGQGGVSDRVAVNYKDGKLAFNVATQMQLGASITRSHEAFLRIELETEEICSLIWPLMSRLVLDRGVDIKTALSVVSSSDGLTAQLGAPQVKPITATSIETALKDNRPPDHCIGLKELGELLCKKGKLPPSVCAVIQPAKNAGTLPAPGVAPIGPLSPVPVLSPGSPSPAGPPGTGAGCAGQPCPVPSPLPPILLIPPLKARDLDRYENLVARGELQHRPGRPRNTNQDTRWQSLMPGRIPPNVLARAQAMGLQIADVIQPYWSAIKALSQKMPVDHIVEMQVTPIGREGQFDLLPNYRLMEASENSSVGSELAQNITKMRDALVAADGSCWRDCDLTFASVNSRSVASPQTWTQEQLIAGEQLDAFERLGRPPRP